MTPPQSTGFAAPTDESVAGLVARASKALKTYGQGRGDKFCLDTHKAMKAMDLGLEALRAQDAALSTLVAERGEAILQAGRAEAELNAVSAAIGSPRFMDPPDGGDVSLGEQVSRMHTALHASEARATALEAERDAEREQAESFKAMYHQACEWRDVKITALEAQLARAREDTIAECIAVIEHIGNWGDYKRDELTKDFGQPRFDMWTEIVEALRSPAPADGRGDQMACEHCDGTGDVHGIDGEWRGSCDCSATPKPDLPSEARADGVKGYTRDLEDAILACESGTALDVLANYRTVRRTVQDVRSALTAAEARIAGLEADKDTARAEERQTFKDAAIINVDNDRLREALNDLLTRPTDPTARIRAREALSRQEGGR